VCAADGAREDANGVRARGATARGDHRRERGIEKTRARVRTVIARARAEVALVARGRRDARARGIKRALTSMTKSEDAKGFD